MPHVQFPVNSQVPPVARAFQPYNFAFAESTFTSTAGPMAYALSNEPAWLRLDSRTRTFSGIPGARDVGPMIFSLIATDTEGPTLLSVMLVVIRKEGLRVGTSFPSQLAGFGLPCNALSVLLYPLQSFAFHFSPDTFLGISSTTTYYAISEDNSPLPSWLKFDASNLGFTGTTPPLIAPTTTPQTYGVKLVVSDVPGFSEASAVFQIVVAYHILAFSTSRETIDAASGREVASSPLRETLRLDGKPISRAELVSVTSNAPGWLLLDQENISLSGIPPAKARSVTVTISVTDLLGDVANATLDFIVSSNCTSLFLGDLPTANATIGQHFDYTISRSLLATADVTLMADLGNTSAWLSFESGSLSFKGNVPQNLIPGPIHIALYATAGQKTEENILRINVVHGSPTTSLSRTTTMAISTKMCSTSVATSSTSATTRNNTPPSKPSRLKTVLATSLSVGGLLLFLALFIFCWWRRQKVLGKSIADASGSITPPTGVDPVERELSPARAVESAYSAEIGQDVLPNEPPRIEFSWAPDSLRKANVQLSKGINAIDGDTLNLSFFGSLPQTIESATPSPKSNEDAFQQLNQRSEHLTPFAGSTADHCWQRGMPDQSNQSIGDDRAARKRASTAFSVMSMAVSGLPSRLSGAGHGAGGVGPPGFTDIRSSCARPGSSLSSMVGETRVLDLVHEFPKPPIQGAEGRRGTTLQRKTPSILRLAETVPAHTDSLIEERGMWRMQTARCPSEGVARLSNAGSSRPLSRGRQLDAKSPSPSRYDEFAAQRSHQGGRPKHPAGGVSRQPEITNPRHSALRSSIRPPASLMPDRSVASSGQFDSALSTTSSQWEDEVFTGEADFLQDETNQFAESARRDEQVSPPHHACSSRSATTATLDREMSFAGGVGICRASQKSRRTDGTIQRVDSVRNEKPQAWEGSHQSRLAFV